MIWSDFISTIIRLISAEISEVLLLILDIWNLIALKLNL